MKRRKFLSDLLFFADKAEYIDTKGYINTLIMPEEDGDNRLSLQYCTSSREFTGREKMTKHMNDYLRRE